MREARIEEILHFWFGELADDADFPTEKAKMWFMEGEKADEVIRRTFGEDLALAVDGKLDAWQSSPRGTLALLIVLDQFPRNIYRDRPQSFAQDGKALAVSLKGIETEKDRALKPVERTFFYMPFMHAESHEYQKRSIELFTTKVMPHFQKAPAKVTSS